MSLSKVARVDRSLVSSQLPVDSLLSAPMTPVWPEARAGAGRRGHLDSVCQPGILQLVEEPPLGVFLVQNMPVFLPTFLLACLLAQLPLRFSKHGRDMQVNLLFKPS